MGLQLAQVSRALAASQAGVNGSSGGGGEKSLAAAIVASAELKLPDELAARAQRQTKICMPQVRQWHQLAVLPALMWTKSRIEILTLPDSDHSSAQGTLDLAPRPKGFMTRLMHTLC